MGPSGLHTSTLRRATTVPPTRYRLPSPMRESSTPPSEMCFKGGHRRRRAEPARATRRKLRPSATSTLKESGQALLIAEEHRSADPL